VEDAWAALNNDTSRPFAKPGSGRMETLTLIGFDLRELGYESMAQHWLRVGESTTRRYFDLFITID